MDKTAGGRSNKILVVLPVNTRFENGNLDPEGIFYECDIKSCGRAFNSKFSLKRHYNMHFKIKMYKCKFCGKGFNLH